MSSHEAGQAWNPERYASNARFVSELGWPVVELLAPRRGERILDLGCGDGELGLRLMALGCEVVGVDASPEMVAAARERGIDARVMDGRSLAFDGVFDAVFSNAALHWMKPPEAVIAGVWRALRPGGRFVAELGGSGNVAAIMEALGAAGRRRGLDIEAISPWYFPSVEACRTLLARQGFSIQTMALFPRPTPLPGDVVAWLETFAGSFIEVLPASERAGFLREVTALCAPRLRDGRGNWTADYVRLRFAALKPRAQAAGFDTHGQHFHQGGDMKRKASASWKGGLKDGKGTISTDSGVLSATPYSFGTRFEDGKGTNPEELIGAAHAGCFSMALSLELEKAGLRPERVDTTATVTLDKSGAGFAISAIHLEVSARVPGADPQAFDKAANDAKNGCPVSKVLNASITLAARLEG
jgi:OsmC subfamily peroxiredoxin